MKPKSSYKSTHHPLQTTGSSLSYHWFHPFHVIVAISSNPPPSPPYMCTTTVELGCRARRTTTILSVYPPSLIWILHLQTFTFIVSDRRLGFCLRSLNILEHQTWLNIWIFSDFIPTSSSSYFFYSSFWRSDLLLVIYGSYCEILWWCQWPVVLLVMTSGVVNLLNFHLKCLNQLSNVQHM